MSHRGHQNTVGTRTLVALGIPAFGIASAYTLATTYLPVLIEQRSGPAVTGAIVAVEGLLALVLPIMVGSWSDSTRTRLGRRVPFILAGAALAVLGLLAVAAGIGSMVAMSAGLALFLVGYFTYQSPYYALFPDVVGESQRGRSQGVQGGFRALGLLLSLATGGFLLHLWHPLPFLVGAAAVVAVTTALLFSPVTRPHSPQATSPGSRRGRAEWHLLRRDPAIRRWTVANSLWEAALGALRVFVVLYFTRGLEMSLVQVSGALTLVGAVALISAPVSGKLADRYGHRPVMLAALWVFAAGSLIPVFTTDRTFIAGIVPVACAAVILLTLPYSLLMGLLPADHDHGVGAGLFGFSRGVGLLAGPVLAGLAVQYTESLGILVFAETDGYSALFAVVCVLLLASVPLLRSIEERPARPREAVRGHSTAGV